MEFVSVIISFPDEETARQIGTAMIKKQHAACVNIIPSVQSIYQWQNELKIDNEVIMVAKTSTEQYQKLEDAIIKEHPYDVPEIIALPIVAGSLKYLNWISGEVDKI